MDPNPYIRILVGNLSIKFLNNPKQASSSSIIFPSTTSCHCKIKLGDFPAQNSYVPLSGEDDHEEGSYSPLAACFTLDKKQIEKAGENAKFYSISVEVYAGGETLICGPWSGKTKLLGKVRIPIAWGEITKVFSSETRGISMQNGWVAVGSTAELRLKVRAETDPRYVFEFGGEPERSPQVFQVQGSSKKQAVFTCKFSLRGSRPSMTESTKMSGEKERERKGWTVTVHDLSGSPVAMASMVTPFVAGSGTNRVSHTSPGAWLILQPSYGAWRPWGRLEAWRDRANSVGYRFNLFNDDGASTSTLASASLSARSGGRFVIDTTNTVATPFPSPQSSFDFGTASPLAFKGFVMSTTVEAGGKASRPMLEIGARHVACTEDAAAFVALSAALDLSMNACTLFTRKLRKELRHQISQSLSF